MTTPDIQQAREWAEGNKEVDGEIWRDIPGYEGIYQVSDHGRVKSLDRIIHSKTGPRKHRGLGGKQ